MGNTSFASLLKKYCLSRKPMRILEWGPGESTEMMIEWCPEAEIYTMEHISKWYDHWSKKFSKMKTINNLFMFLVEAPENNREDILWGHYTQPELFKKFDLIFIDGRERVRCMKYAKKMLSGGGVVILHDAHRGEYQKGIELFKVIDKDHDTVVME